MVAMQQQQTLESVVEDDDDASRHDYPASAMAGDYLRAATGLVPSGLLLATIPTSAAVAAVLGSLAAIFAAFGLRTLLRHGTSLEMSATELRARGLWPGTIAWDELDRMKLAYYSTRRDRTSGWMQLELAGGGARLGLDSRIAGFDQLVRRATAAAAARGVALSDATLANLAALGIRVPDARPRR